MLRLRIDDGDEVLMELLEWLARPLLWLARGLLWLAWDFFVFGIAWSIGWPIWRALTFGRFPHVDYREYDDAGFFEIVLVSGVGLGVLAGAVWGLSQFLASR
jgi:hypothetical protein